MAEVLERGDIQFFFRPTVQPAELVEPVPLGVQAFFVVLSPAGKSHRRVRIGRKRMPAPSGERFWARVERVGSFDRVFGGQLEDELYTTKTRGERYQPAARPIAQGCYAFVQHDDHTHFVYRIEHAEGDVPDEVRVPEAASNVVLFETHREGAEPGSIARRGQPRARRPAGRGVWTVAGEIARFDHEGEELVLVGVDDEPERELGIDVLPESTVATAKRC